IEDHDALIAEHHIWVVRRHDFVKPFLRLTGQHGQVDAATGLDGERCHLHRLREDAGAILDLCRLADDREALVHAKGEVLLWFGKCHVYTSRLSRSSVNPHRMASSSWVVL